MPLGGREAEWVFCVFPCGCLICVFCVFYVREVLLGSLA